MKYDTYEMQKTVQVMEVMQKNGISVLHYKMSRNAVTIVCTAPGFGALVSAQHQLQKLLGAGACEIPALPRRPPMHQLQQNQNFAGEKCEKTFEYVSDIQNFEQIHTESVKVAAENLKSIRATDPSVITKDVFYSKLLG